MERILKEILLKLIQNSRKSVSELARELELPRTSIYNKIKFLINEGYIKKFTLIPNFNKLGYKVLAFIHVVVSHNEEFNKILEKLKSLKNVEEVHAVTGQFDIIIKARFKEIEELYDFIYNKLRSWKGVARSETMIVVKTEKEYHFNIE